MARRSSPAPNSNEFDHLEAFASISSQDLQGIDNSDIRKIMSDNESADNSDVELPQPHTQVEQPPEPVKPTSKPKRPRSSNAGKSRSASGTSSKLPDFITKMKQKKQKHKLFKKALDQQLTTIDKKRKKLQEDLKKLADDEKAAKTKYSNSSQAKEFADAQEDYTKHKSDIVRKRIHDNAEKIQKLLMCSVSNIYDPEEKFGIHLNSKNSQPEFVYRSHSDLSTFISLDCFDFLFADDE